MVVSWKIVIYIQSSPGRAIVRMWLSKTKERLWHQKHKKAPAAYLELEIIITKQGSIIILIRIILLIFKKIERVVHVFSRPHIFK